MNFKEEYFSLWGEVWQFHKEFANINGTDDEWQKVVDSAEEIVKRYEGKSKFEFVKSLVLAILNELERRDREKRENGQSSSKGINLKKE